MALGKTKAQLLSQISSYELSEWMVYEQVEPFGDRRGDFQAALICMTLANRLRNKDEQPFKMQDFLLDFERARAEQTMEEQIAFAHMMTIALGGKDRRGAQTYEYPSEAAGGPGG